jgi:hypothetical protein
MSEGKKLYELTPEHRVQLRPWRDRWIVVLDRAATRRAMASGACSLTLFPTMRDLQPLTSGPGLRSHWEKATEYVRRAIEQEASQAHKAASHSVTEDDQTAKGAGGRHSVAA